MTTAEHGEHQDIVQALEEEKQLLRDEANSWMHSHHALAVKNTALLAENARLREELEMLKQRVGNSTMILK